MAVHIGSFRHQAEVQIELDISFMNTIELMRDRISCPIIPGKELAGIPLGIHLDEISDLVDLKSKDTSFIGTASYKLNIGCVSIGVHEKSNRVFRISAFPGYKGKLFNTYQPTQPIQLLIDDPDWEFSEEHGVIIHKKITGVAISANFDDPKLEDILEDNIFEISVFVNNIDTLDVDWESVK